MKASMNLSLVDVRDKKSTCVDNKLIE